jgi:hypothetical protein
MLLLLLFGVVASLALAVEVLNFVAREFLSGVRREDTLKAALAQIHKDLDQADDKLGGVKSNLRKALNDLDKARTSFQEVEKEIARRHKLEPVLVYPVGSEVGTGFRFRAPLTKTLPEKPEENQTLLWKRESYVEIWTNSEDQARAGAEDQFPRKHGYTIGPFVRTGDEAMEKAA